MAPPKRQRSPPTTTRFAHLATPSQQHHRRRLPRASGLHLSPHPQLPLDRSPSPSPSSVPALPLAASMEGLPFGWAQRHKRSHDEMNRRTEPRWSFDQLNNAHTYNHSATREHNPVPRASAWPNLDLGLGRQTPVDAVPWSTLRNDDQGQTMPSRAPRRFEGDGFDYRSPTFASRGQSAAAAFDLTGDDDDDDEHEEEDEGDNEDDFDLDMDMDMEMDMNNDSDFGEEQDVIDLTADDSGYGASQDEDPVLQQNNDGIRIQHIPRGMDVIIDLESVEGENVEEPGSPDIEFISSRPRVAPLNRDTDEVEFVSANALPVEEIRRRRDRDLSQVIDLLGTMHGRFNHLRQQVDRFNAQVNITADRLRRNAPVVIPRNGNRGRVGHGFMAPDLDFATVGFNLGMGGRAEPPPPTYEAPEEAPEGFTRSPQEEDVLVCPNCDKELCCGDGEVKKQVWVVKGCGHVYCGDCTANRSSKRSAKGKERTGTTKPFKECRVSGCGKSVTNRKAMVQIFM